MTNLNLRHLEAFAAIATSGNFTRAAQVLHISQPALTVQIRQLEDTIGARLIDRTTRSMKLTAIGQELSPVVQRLLREIDAVLHSAHDLAAGVRGQVSVAVLPSVCSTILPGIIATFRKQHPNITVALNDALAARVLAMVKEEQVDIGIGSFSDADDSLRSVPLFSDRMRAVLPRNAPLARKRTLRLKDLAAAPLILMHRQSSVRTLIDRAFQAIGEFPHPAYETTYMSSAVGMVKAGLGYAFLPSSATDMWGMEGVASRPLRDAGLTRHIVAVSKASRSLSPATEAFLRVLIGAFKSGKHL